MNFLPLNARWFMRLAEKVHQKGDVIGGFGYGLQAASLDPFLAATNSGFLGHLAYHIGDVGFATRCFAIASVQGRDPRHRAALRNLMNAAGVLLKNVELPETRFDLPCLIDSPKNNGASTNGIRLVLTDEPGILENTTDSLPDIDQLQTVIYKHSIASVIAPRFNAERFLFQFTTFVKPTSLIVDLTYKGSTHAIVRAETIANIKKFLDIEVIGVTRQSSEKKMKYIINAYKQLLNKIVIIPEFNELHYDYSKKHQFAANEISLETH